jgi:hypothetical protein
VHNAVGVTSDKRDYFGAVLAATCAIPGTEVESDTYATTQQQLQRNGNSYNVMATGQGTATLDFGAFPGSNEASVTVTGQTSISATSKAEAFVMGDDTSGTHTASDHRYFAALVGLTCGNPTDAIGFTIFASSTEKLTGTFVVRWVWAD